MNISYRTITIVSLSTIFSLHAASEANYIKYLKSNKHIATYLPSIGGLVGKSNFEGLEQDRCDELLQANKQLEEALRQDKKYSDIKQLADDVISATKFCVSADFEKIEERLAKELERLPSCKQ